MTFFESRVATLLSDNWNISNTNSRTPTIRVIYDLKRTNLWDADYILTYAIAHSNRPNAFGNVSKKVVDRCRIDVRSKYSLAHLSLMATEVERIIDGKRKQPFGDYMDLQFEGEGKNLSDRTTGFYHYVFDVQGRIGTKEVTPI